MCLWCARASHAQRFLYIYIWGMSVCVCVFVFVWLWCSLWIWYKCIRVCVTTKGFLKNIFATQLHGKETSLKVLPVNNIVFRCATVWIFNGFCRWNCNGPVCCPLRLYRPIFNGSVRVQIVWNCSPPNPFVAILPIYISTVPFAVMLLK